jgi:Lhr-like helicase
VEAARNIKNVAVSKLDQIKIKSSPLQALFQVIIIMASTSPKKTVAIP